MDVVEAVRRAGGFSSRARLVAETSRAEVDAALRGGALVATGRGRYALPGQDTAPALVDLDLGIVLEADSFAWHGGRAALDRDARRCNRLVTAGFLVLRFTWEDVMFRPSEVAEIIRLAVQRRTRVDVQPPKNPTNRTSDRLGSARARRQRIDAGA